MVLDYSKWEALEVSDDSDIEVHQNVHKPSFIRAKQNQIHQERQRRRHEITTLKYEQIINEGILLRIGRLLTALRSHRDAVNSSSTEELIFQALMESAGDPTEDSPPPPPEGVHANVTERPTFSKIMAALVDQVKKAVEEVKPDNKFEAYISGIEKEQAKVTALQKELLQKLADLEKLENSKITSDNLRIGFDSSHITHNEKPSSSKAKKGVKTGAVTESVELLNSGAAPRNPLQRQESGQTSGTDADVEDAAPDGEDDDDIQASAEGKEFAEIAVGDYRACMQYISENPSVLAERETDGLLVEAFNKQMDGKGQVAKQCVHQALLLQYCRQLGRDGVGIFFKRITTPGHQAQKVFEEDVNNTYNRIKTRTAELATKKDSEEAAGGVEQIQLHAVDPNTQINIQVPRLVSDLPENIDEESKKGQVAARQLYESFPPGLQRALESGSLDDVNKVLAKMSVDEAEDVVQKMGDGGMLSLEEGVIDATTEEGKKKVEEIEKTHKMPGEADNMVEATANQSVSNDIDQRSSERN